MTILYSSIGLLVGIVIGILLIRGKKEALRVRCELLEAQLQSERTQAVEQRKSDEERWEERLDTLRKELQLLTVEQLSIRQKALQESNSSQMHELLAPIREQFKTFEQRVQESKTQSEVNKQELKSAFESNLRLFQQQQQAAVEAFQRQTERIGDEANQLSKALKGDNKMQGDWGEMILETILENSGLRRNEEFFVQEQVEDERGNKFRPDVVVRFPEGKSVIIDSKVSLTAYVDALSTEDQNECERLLKEHARSVRKHVDELSTKHYESMIKGNIGFVLMFIPNENSFITAMKQQPELSHYAYQKKIIIISPNTLILSLQLAYNLWQYDKQGKNVEKIVKSAADLYDKVAGFVDTFREIGNQLTHLQQSYSIAKDRLVDGKGNVLRRIETLKEMGITPKKNIAELEE